MWSTYVCEIKSKVNNTGKISSLKGCTVTDKYCRLILIWWPHTKKNHTLPHKNNTIIVCITVTRTKLQIYNAARSCVKLKKYIMKLPAQFHVKFECFAMQLNVWTYLRTNYDYDFCFSCVNLAVRSDGWCLNPEHWLKWPELWGFKVEFLASFGHFDSYKKSKYCQQNYFFTALWSNSMKLSKFNRQISIHFRQVLFGAGNQGNHLNFDLSLLSYKWWLIFIGMFILHPH